MIGESVTNQFKALVIREGASPSGPQTAGIETLTDDELPDGDVIVDIDYSSLNYKDGMALTGTGRIIRTFPMVPGIDFAGTVASSTSPDFSAGDPVILTGWGVGERYWGGYSQRQRVHSEWLGPRPAGLSRLPARATGTTRLPAMMGLLPLQATGASP